MKLSLRQNLILGTSLLTLVAFSLTACSDGMEPSGGKKEETAASDDPAGGVQEAQGSADAAQLAAFSDTLYPLLSEHCGQCHASTVAPHFADTDSAAALKTINTSQLVTLTEAATSRLVKRLTEQAHNCWGDCAENGTEFVTAIEAWAAAAGGGTAEQEFVELASVPISTAGEITLRGGYNKTWVRAAAYPDSYGDRMAPLDDARASQRRVMYRVPDFTTITTPKPEGGAHYYFEIPESDTETYQICYRVKTNITVPGIETPLNQGTRVFSNINGNSLFGGRDLDNGVAPDATGAAQVGTNYVWMPAFYGVDANSQTVPMAYNLKPMKGSTKLDLYVYDAEPAIDLIALSATSATCSGTAVPNSGRVFGFAFDLTEKLGQKATFSIQYLKSADGLAQVFSRPTIELENPATKVHIEEIYVVINDQIDRTLNTFASVNTDVTGGSLLSTADLIVPLGTADDKVGIHIGKISILP